MNNNKETISGHVNLSMNIPFIFALTFITLKLIGIISWSWWWVLSPIWITLGIGLIAFIVKLVIALKS